MIQKESQKFSNSVLASCKAPKKMCKSNLFWFCNNQNVEDLEIKQENN